MKVIALFLVLCVASAVALPPGFSSPQEVTEVLNNEPDSAKEARFASKPEGNTIVFRNTGSSSSDDDDEGDAEFDAQIEQVDNDMKKLKENIKESQECARRLAEQEAELKSLEEQKEHLEKEKEKRVLQVKLEKQMKDLSEINKMSRSLRMKFADLKRTQKAIKLKMIGTRTSLNQLDGEPDVTADDTKEAANNLGSEMDAMQAVQQKILATAHKAASKQVKNQLNLANKLHKAARKEIEKTDA